MFPNKKVSPVFSVIKTVVGSFIKKCNIYGIENLPEHDAVIIANHSQMTGPIYGELFMKENCYIWCAGQLMHLKDVPAYAYEDFWSQKPKASKPFFKVLSYLIAPLSVLVFNNARTIGVYHDSRLLSTFRNSINLLKSGGNILIFPESHETHNNIVYKFQDRFVDLARMYKNSTGRNLMFVPMYICPKLHGMYIGKPIEYCSENDAVRERERICSYLSDTITEMAVNLPEHLVVPYANIPKKKYLTNKSINEVPE